MSNNMQRNISQRKQVKSALERIDSLEQETAQLVGGINQAFSNTNAQVTQLAAILEAAVELLGASTVDAKIKEIADGKVLRKLESAKAALTAGLEKGTVVKADAVSDKSLVVGREFDAKGEVVFPGRVQLEFRGIKPEFQDQLLGKGASTVLETANGGKFEVLEVYDVVEAQPEAAAETPASLDETLTPSEG